MLNSEVKDYSRPLNIYKNLDLEKIKEGTDDYKTFEARKKYIKDNTTFVIPGHNIKLFAALATESLAKRCNVNKNQIFYFNDKSTDGAIEELEKRGFNVITWDEDTYSDFINSEYNDNLPIRVNQILTAAYKQISTKYICFLDGDVFYFDDAIDFILKLICEKEYETNIQFSTFGISRHAGSIFQYNPIWDSVWQSFFWIDAEFLKQNNLFGEKIEDIRNYMNTYPNDDCLSDFDTGCSIYQRLKSLLDSSSFFINTDNQENLLDILTNEKTFHMGNLSSSMRNDIHSIDQTFTVDNITQLLNNSNIIDLCNELGFDIKELKISFFTNFRKTPLTD